MQGAIMSEVVRIKPHHFVDILTQYGGGTRTWLPSDYGHALHVVAERLLKEQGVILEMCSGADDICTPCIHNINGSCDDRIDTSFRPQSPSSKREWNLLIDNRWYRVLGLREHQRLTAREFVLLVGDSIDAIGDIYREIPPEKNADRATRLGAGVRKYTGPA